MWIDLNHQAVHICQVHSNVLAASSCHQSCPPSWFQPPCCRRLPCPASFLASCTESRSMVHLLDDAKRWASLSHLTWRTLDRTLRRLCRWALPSTATTAPLAVNRAERPHPTIQSTCCLQKATNERAVHVKKSEGTSIWMLSVLAQWNLQMALCWRRVLRDMPPKRQQTPAKKWQQFQYTPSRDCFDCLHYFDCLYLSLIVIWFYHAAEKLNRGLQPMDQFLRLDQQIHPGVAPRRWSSKPSEVVWWPQPRLTCCCNVFLADHVQSSGTPSKYLRLSRKPYQKWVVM